MHIPYRGVRAGRLNFTHQAAAVIDVIPENAEPIPEYDGYLITPDGEVYSTKWNGPRRMKTTDDGKVCLWRNNKRFRPQASKLVDRTFGEGQDENSALLDDIREEYGDSLEVQVWLKTV